MELVYSLDRKEIERRFIEDGQTLPMEQRIPFPVEALTPELRAHLARTVGPRVPDSFKLTVYRPDLDGARLVSYPGDQITLPEMPDESDAVALLIADAARWDAAETQRQQRAAERAAERAQAEAENRRRDEERQRIALADAAAATQRQADKAAWIAAHGSPFLRRAAGAGYDCQRRYVIERAALERPGYVVDFNDNARWSARSCPSEAALSEALVVGGTVVWLTALPVDDNSPEEYQVAWQGGCEAVAIRQYLGKYDLVKIV